MTDERLIERYVQTKDEDAATELVHRYQERLTDLMVGRWKNHALAEDIVQSALALVFEKAHQFDPQKGCFGSWLYGTCQIEGLLANRRKKKRIPEIQASPELLICQQHRATHDPHYAEQEEFKSNFWSHLDSLSSPQKQLLCLVFVEGRSFRDVAALVSAHMEQIRRAVSKLLPELKAALGGLPQDAKFSLERRRVSRRRQPENFLQYLVA